MNIEIANRLQQLRKEKGYSQEELADKLGISRQAISKWERAESSPDTDNLILLARLYGVSLDELLSTDADDDEIRSEAFEQNNNPNIYINGEKLEYKDASGVHINKDGIFLNGDFDKDDFQNDDTEDKPLSKGELIDLIINGVYALLCLLAYLFVSFYLNLWHPAWLIFLTIPLFSTLIEAIRKKKFCHFCYPILVAIIYLHLGLISDLWHPMWILFITIPVYYMIFNPLDKIIHRNMSKSNK